MFNKYFIQLPDTEGPKEIARATRELGKTMKSISEADIKSKDRVDIPLSEYLEMKETIRNQESELRSLYCTFRQLGISKEVVDGIVPDSVKVYKDEDIKDFITHYMIKFDFDVGFDILRRSYR